jgi:hypothetical protein
MRESSWDWPLKPHAVVFAEMQPWLLGWSQWYVGVHYGNGPHGHFEVLARGRWRWRGRRAEYAERFYIVQGNGVADGPAFAGAYAQG